MAYLTYRFNEYAPDHGDYFGDKEGHLNITDCAGVLPNSTGYREVTRFLSMDGIDPTLNFRTIPSGGTVSHNLFSYTGLDGSTLPKNEWLLGYDGGSAAGTALRKRDLSAVYSTVGRAGGYGASGAFGWQFTRFGNSIIATNRTDAIQRSTVTTTAGTFAKNNVVTGPVTADPRCRFVESFKGYLFLGWIDMTAGTSGAETYGGAYGPITAGIHGEMVWWSDLDDPTRFSTPLTTPSVLNSDFKRFTDGYGSVTGLCATHDYLVICRENAIMACVGPPFSFYPITSSVGSRYQNSLVASGTDVYLWTRRGPAVIKNGQEIQFIGEERLSRYYEEFVGTTLGRESAVHGAVTIDGRYIVWTLPTSYSATGEWNYILIYSIDQDSFGLIKEDYISNVSPMCSYNIPLQSYGSGTFNTSGSYALDGVSFIGSHTAPGVVAPADTFTYLFVPGSTGGSMFTVAAQTVANVSPLVDVAKSKIRTCFFSVPKDVTARTLSIKKIRPIYFDAGDQDFPGPAPDSESIVGSKIRLYPRNRYCRQDRNGTEDPDPNSYIEFNSSEAYLNPVTGYLTTPDVPFAEMWSIELIFTGSVFTRNIHGFDMEVEYGQSEATYNNFGW